jgi:D-glycero-D-manno-heptose 1,7-bisphosphate phosphatase
MLLQAAEDLQLDLKRSWMIGDAARDLEAGERAGARSLLVRTGKGSALARERNGEGITVTENIADAARWILAQA